jgi:hypothetical protein
MSLSIDWSRLEEIVERVVRRARAEELRDIAEAIKTLADFMRTGFKEVLDRIERIEKRLEAVESILLKHSKSIEELNKTLMEHSKRLEELSKRVEEMNKVLMEHSKRLEEHSKRLEELAKEVARQGVVLGSIGRRWGKDLEKMVLELYRHVLEERGMIPEKIERFTYVDSDGRYYVKDSKIEFDIYMHNERIYLVEIKSHADVEDVEWLYKRAEIYEKIAGRKPDKLMLVAIHIDDDAYARAKELGIDVIYGAIIP